MRITIEERIAKKLVEISSDFNLDLEMVGYYIARVAPTLIFNRIMVVLEAAQHEKEQIENDRKHPYYRH